jgi:outer membrane lipoprotein SlyB
MKKTLHVSLALSVALVLMTGCATSELQTSARMTQSVFINPVAKDKRTIFVSTKNTSGAPINLENRMIQALYAKGYTIVDDPEMATYVLMTNILFCNKKSENNVVAGAVMGGAAGAIANSGSSGRGMAAAGLGGAVVGGLIGKATEDTIFQMQVDIVIREKSKGRVMANTGNVSGQAGIRDGQRAGTINSFGGPIRDTDANGHMYSNTYSSASQSYESDYIEHRTMMFAEATKMNLTLYEATPILEDKIAQQVAGLF